MDTHNPDTNSDFTEIKISLPTHAYFVSGIRDFTLNLIKNLTNFSEQWAYRFQSIVDELCNNAIEHGSIKGKNIFITFKAQKSDYVEIIVEDLGNPVKPQKSSELKKMLEERRKPGYIHMGIRGRGLSKIVAEWTDELEFTDRKEGGISVRVKKFLNDPKLSEENKTNNKNLLIIN